MKGKSHILFLETSEQEEASILALLKEAGIDVDSSRSLTCNQLQEKKDLADIIIARIHSTLDLNDTALSRIQVEPGKILAILDRFNEKQISQLLNGGVTRIVSAAGLKKQILPAFLSLIRERQTVARPEDLSLNEKELHKNDVEVSHSLQFFDSVFNTIGALILVMDAEGRIVKFNRTCEVVSGYLSREVIGKKPVDLFVPAIERSGLESVFANLREGEYPIAFIHTWRTRKGDERIIEWTYTAIKDDAGVTTNIIGTGVDSTDRFRAGRALRASEERFERIFHSSMQPSAIISYETEQFIDVNDAFLSLFHCEKEELVGRTIAEANSIIETIESSLFRQMAYQDGFVKPTKCQIRDRFGVIHHLLLSVDQIQLGGQMCFIAYLLDITDQVKKSDELRQSQEILEQKVTERTAQLEAINQSLSEEIRIRIQREDELRRSEEKYRILSEAAHDIIFVIDLQGRLEYANSMAIEFLGAPVESLLGCSLRDLLSSKNFRQGPVDLKRIVKLQASSYLENQYVVNGQTFWLGTWYTPIRNQEGNVEAIMGVSRDITEKRKNLEELTRAFEQEKELANMRSRFISMTSHEFRTPISAILSSAELLEYYGSNWTEEKCKYHLKKIQNSAKYINETLNDVLNFSRMDQVQYVYQPVWLDIDEIIHEVVDDIRVVEKVHHPIIVSYEETPPRLWADRNLIRQVMYNLIENASKYSPQATEIHITMVNHQDDLEIHIIDQGIGIPLEDQITIFDAFRRGSNVEQISGTGLGLPIVKKAMGFLRGQVTFKSNESGTDFEIHFPLNGPGENL